MRSSMRAVAAMALLGGFAAVAAADCGSTQAPLLYGLRATSPLVGGVDEPALVVEVFADGCAVSHRPVFMRRSGTTARRLPPAELHRLGEQVANSGVAALDTEALRLALRSKESAHRAEDTPLWRVSDDTIVELHIADGPMVRTISWGSLRQDLANHPDEAGVLALATAIELLLDVERSVSGAEDEK